MEKSGNILYRRGRQFAAVALAGSLAVGLAACESLRDDSKIVAGVPGQVEEHLSGRHCSMRIKAICTRWEPDYYLGVEQCPADVAAAKAGHQTESFDPKVGETYVGCVYDTVRVSADTYQAYADGSTIVFGGAVGHPLTKQ